MLAKRSNAMWDILIGDTEEAVKLTGSILTTKSLRMQTEYMGTRKTKITLHRMPMDITDDHLGAYFSQYEPVGNVSPVKVSYRYGRF